MAGSAAWNRDDMARDLARGWDLGDPGPSCGGSADDPSATVAQPDSPPAPNRPFAVPAWTIGLPRGVREPSRAAATAASLGAKASAGPGPGLAPTLSRTSADDGSGGFEVDCGLGPPGGGATSASPSPAFPEPGDEVAGFFVLSELGRGAFARVYLAQQANLANRPVALKASKIQGDEHRALARLQHTHIVPIHSVHDDPRAGLRLLCMPYLGGANLAQVLEAAGAKLPCQATGFSLVEALDRVGTRLDAPGSALADLSRPAASRASSPAPARAPTPPPAAPSTPWAGWRRSKAVATAPTGSTAGSEAAAEATSSSPVSDLDQPSRRYLIHATYIQASVWIAARLAEGLAHAHSRGLLHRDLKPSNILIAADGTPMLLDFNLSADAQPEAHDARTRLGGTLPYMAPEHLDAFNPRGSTLPEAVDERSDLYSLGLILFEMVAGRPAFPETARGTDLVSTLREMSEQRAGPAPSLRSVVPQAPWGLDSVLRKLLDPDPDRRYARAAYLADDLQRLLDDRPLKHAPEPSLRECAAKWMRRNPRVTSASNLGLAAMLLLLTCWAMAWFLSSQLETAAARLKLADFRAAFDRSQLLLNIDGPPGHIDTGIKLAREALASFDPDGRADWTEHAPADRLSAAELIRLREDIAELELLLARAEVARVGHFDATDRGRREALERAVDWLNRAERADPRPTAALFEERARDLAALGRGEAAARDRDHAKGLVPTTCRDFYLRGVALLAAGHADRAETPLAHAVALDGRRFWAWFALGLCHLKQGRNLEAAGDFGVCTALAPDFAWPHLNRGLALAAAGRLVEARAAYDRALSLNDQFAEALVDRGLTLLELGEPAAAERDLSRAVALGRSEPATQLAHAEALGRLGRRDEAGRAFANALRERPDDPLARVASGFFHLATDPAAASADFRHALKVDPHHARAHLGLALVRRETDPRAALAHADNALAAEPTLVDALQVRALLRGRLGEVTALDDVDQLTAVPTAAHLYNAACATSLLAQTTQDPRLLPRALGLLRRAIDAGADPRIAPDDPDLVPLRDLPEFIALVGGH